MTSVFALSSGKFSSIDDIMLSQSSSPMYLSACGEILRLERRELPNSSRTALYQKVALPPARSTPFPKANFPYEIR